MTEETRLIERAILLLRRSAGRCEGWAQATEDGKIKDALAKEAEAARRTARELGLLVNGGGKWD